MRLSPLKTLCVPAKPQDSKTRMESGRRAKSETTTLGGILARTNTDCQCAETCGCAATQSCVRNSDPPDPGAERGGSKASTTEDTEDHGEACDLLMSTRLTDSITAFSEWQW